MMKHFVLRTAALILCLALFLSCPALAGRPEYDLPLRTERYSDDIDDSLDADDAFARGNECYENGEYAEAEDYYLLSLQQVEDSLYYDYGDIANNIALTYLHQGYPEDAEKLLWYALEEDLAPTSKDRFGYVLNLLVSAHAQGDSAAKVFSKAVEEGYFSFEKLAEEADSDSGHYTKLLVAMLYNAVYMDMEADPAAGLESYSFYPADHLADVSGTDVMKSLADRFSRIDWDLDEDDQEEIEETLPKLEYLQTLRHILETAQEWNEKTFDETDPDLAELIDYLDALTAQTEEASL